MIAIANKELEIILKTLTKLPPVSPGILLTKDQNDDKEQCHIYWYLIGVCFAATFAGQSVKERFDYELKHNPKLSNIDVPYPEIILGVADEWIDFYLLLNKAWSEIKSHYKSINCQLPANSPGEALSFILKEITFHEFSICLMPYSESQPKQIYRHLTKVEKLEKKSHKKSPLKELFNESYPFIEDQKIENFIKRDRQNLPNGSWSDGHLFKDTCLEICESSKDTSIKDFLKRYRQTKKKVSKIRKRLCANNVSKHTIWCKGKRIK